MDHKIIYAVDSKNNDILGQFVKRLSSAGVRTKHLKSSEKYTYLESVWDDTDLPGTLRKNNAGAKPKELQYEGKPVSCGLVYCLRNEKKLSDADIGLLLDVSESTIRRRRKKHMENGCFHGGNTSIF